MVSSGSRPVRLGVSGAVAVSLVVTLLGAAPAAGSDEITASERASWSEEERAAHGQSLWPVRESEELVEADAETFSSKCTPD